MKKEKEEKEKELKPFNAVIQVCPRCGAFDVYKDDGHKCDPEYQAYRREAQEYGDND